MPKADPAAPQRVLASQTLFRGLDVIDAVASGSTTLPAISEKTGITLSTTHRLASALVQQRYLKFEARKGYSLGTKLIELGFLAHRQLDLPKHARAFLEKLAADTRDTVHLAALDNQEVIYLDKMAGQRAVEISSRIGGRKLVCSTGVGKALMLDQGEAAWRAQYAHDAALGGCGQSEEEWLALMRSYAAKGYTFDLGEDAPLIRCVAAPIRDASGRIVAAISVSGALDYMDEARLADLVPVVRSVADAISEQLGARN
ncbi:MAG: IclR family transcriptional regulator [Pseudomonadota bacterium]